jgi:4-amino-4-deoxy-L-arabinose transferase-like glycosyltransferase
MKRTWWLLLATVILIAAGLRLWGLDFGLPYLYHPDEPKHVTLAQNIFKTGDLNPHRFRYPPLFFYINAIAYIPYYLAGRLVGVFQSTADLRAPAILVMGVGQAPLPSVFLLGRAVTVSFSIASVIMVFVLGRQITGNTAVGLLAALMLAVSPTNVENARYIAPNAHVAFFVLLATWAALRVLEEGRTWQYAAAGIAAGLAASTKYNAGLVVLSVILAHFLRNGWRAYRDSRLYGAIALCAVAFLLTTPFVILDPETFFMDLGIVADHYTTGHMGEEGNSLQWYLTYLLSVEGVVCVLAVLEIVRGLRARSKPTILLAFFPVVYLAFISSFVVRNARTVLTVIPFVFLLASMLVVAIADRAMALEYGTRRRLIVAGVIIGLLTLLGLSLSRTVQDNLQITAIDGRETARVWIDQNLTDGARIAIESYAPYVNPERFSVEGMTRMIDHPPEWYSERGFEYLVFSEGMFGRFYRELDRYEAEVAMYEEFFERFELVREFNDGGYEVRIHRVSEVQH